MITVVNSFNFFVFYYHNLTDNSCGVKQVGRLSSEIGFRRELKIDTGYDAECAGSGQFLSERSMNPVAPKCDTHSLDHTTRVDRTERLIVSSPMIVQKQKLHTDNGCDRYRI